MSIFRKVSTSVILLLFAMNVMAAASCEGTIKSVYKWHYMDRISVMLSSTNKWINLPTKSDESMALMAFAAKKPVYFYWAADDVTSCWDGWADNRSLEGYFLVKQ